MYAFRTIGLFVAFFGSNRPSNVPPSLAAWLPDSNFAVDQEEFLDDDKRHYHPFKLHGNHKASCEKAELSDKAKKRLQESLGGKGCQGAWMRCGGSAPIDFILVVREGNTIKLRYMDAKHTQTGTASLGSDKMQEKVRMVHAGMVEALVGLFPPCVVERFEPAHFVIITNDATRHDAISPATFKWHPWSDVLFLPEKK